MREVDRFGDLGDDVADLVEAQRPSLREDLFEVLSLDVLHGDEVRAARLVLTDVMNGDDRRMIENARGLRLANETLLEFMRLVVVPAHGADGLQRDQTADQWVLRKVNYAHRALAELADDLVTAELHRTFSATLRPRFKGRPIGRQ